MNVEQPYCIGQAVQVHGSLLLPWAKSVKSLSFLRRVVLVYTITYFNKLNAVAFPVRQSGRHLSAKVHLWAFAQSCPYLFACVHSRMIVRVGMFVYCQLWDLI